MNPRTTLQRVRDVLLSIMAVLVSLVCALILFLAAAGFDALSEIGKPDPMPTFNLNPEPVPTNTAGEECIGEIPPPGC